MANVKISALPPSAGVVGTEELPVNDSGTTKKVTVDQVKTLADANSFVTTNGAGLLGSAPAFGVNASGGANWFHEVAPNGSSGFENFHTVILQVDPAGNSPNQGYSSLFVQTNLDPNSTGFQIGTAGTAAYALNLNLNHVGTGDVGSLSFINMNSTIGNGTDIIDVAGINLALGFTNVAANVNLTGAIQGYGFQPTVNNAATTSGGNVYANAFYDTAQLAIPIDGYITFNSSPTIEEITNNHSYTGVNLNPTITTLTGNANITGLAVAGTLPAFGATGGYNGINLSTNVSTMGASGYYNGVFVGGTITTSHGTVNALSVNQTVTGGDAAWNGLSIIGNSVDTSGDRWCINLTSDFANGTTGIGNINSSGGHHTLSVDVLAASTIGQGYGNVLSGSLTIPDATAITGSDYILNNLAFTLDTGDATSSYTSVLFGIAPVGFVGLLSGAGDVDNVSFCLGGYANATTGGTITNVYNFNALAIDNGATGTITNSYGFHYATPFGPVATNHWGIHIEDAENNYIETCLSIGATTVTNTSVGFELSSTTKAVLLSRMDTTARDALTAVNGMVIYNTTANKFQGYENGAWTNLI